MPRSAPPCCDRGRLRRAVLRALRDHETHWHHVATNAPAYIVITDRQGLATWVNRWFLAEDPIGKSIFRTLDAEQAAHGRRIIDEVVATGQSATFDSVAMGPNGPVSFQTGFAPLRRGEEIVGTIVVAIDVTASNRQAAELAAREEALRQAEELAHVKQQFVSAVTHELRTPLTTIKGYAEFLEDRLEGPLTNGQRDFVQSIQRATRRLENLVDDLLDLAQADAGTFQLRIAPDDLVRRLEDVAAGFAPQLREADLALELTLPPSLPLHADGARIEQVVSNLLANAVKFTPPGGRVALVARVEGREARLEVHDGGPGIAPEDAPKLFSRFTQLPLGVTRGGSGLGLSISKLLVEAHGGEIGVESEPGQGAHFWVTLPLEPPAP